MPKWSYSALVCTLVSPKELPQDIKHTGSCYAYFEADTKKGEIKQQQVFQYLSRAGLENLSLLNPSTIAGSAKERGNHVDSHGDENCLTGLCKANQLHFLTPCPRVLLQFTCVALGKLLSEIVQAEELVGLWEKSVAEAEDKAHLNNWFGVTAPWGTSISLKAQRSVPPVCDSKQGKCGSDLPDSGLY